MTKITIFQIFYSTMNFSSGKGYCLENRPVQDDFTYPSSLAGKLYDGDAQCRLHFGSFSRQCKFGVRDLNINSLAIYIENIHSQHLSKQRAIHLFILSFYIHVSKTYLIICIS